MNVLVTAIGSFSADIVIKTLKKSGWKVFGCDIYPKEWIVDAQNVDLFYQSPYASDEEKYITFILHITKKHNITYLLPSTDIEIDVLNKYRKKLEANNVRLCISKEETIRLCRNKLALQKYLTQNGIENTILTKKLEEVDIDSLQYPIVCKPVDGRSSQGLTYIYNENEMIYFKEKVRNKHFIIQPLIEGNIITADVIRHAESKQVVVLLRKELLRTINGAGTSVYTFWDDILEKECKKIAEILEINGCVNFEFILDQNGKYHFLECNPRFSGGIEFSCMSGYNCIKNHFNCFTNNKIDNKDIFISQYIARKYEEYITKVCEKDRK